MKKILLISDLHQQYYVLKKIEDFLSKHKLDAIILAGDLTNRAEGSLDYAKKFEKIIKKNKIKFFFVSGNNDSKEVIEYFKEKKYLIDSEEKIFEGFKIVGIGSNEEYYLKNFNLKDSILVTHNPPILTTINLKNSPIVHIFAHTHFWEYKRKISGVLLIQLKATMFNRACILKLPKLEVEFLDL